MGWIRIGDGLSCRDPLTRAAVAKLVSEDPLDVFEAGEQLGHAIERQTRAGAAYVLVDLDDLEREQPRLARQAVGPLLGPLHERGGGAPPCFVSDDPGLLEAGLGACAELWADDAQAPLVGGISAGAPEVFDLRQRFSFGLIVRLSDPTTEDDERSPALDAETYHQSAQEHFEKARAAGFAPDELFFDLGASPLRSDTSGRTREAFEGAKRILGDEALAGVHALVAVADASEGLPRRIAVERAYVRVAGEYGVDAAICDATQISGEELVDPKVLRLVRAVVEKPGEALGKRFADYMRGHAVKPSPLARAAPPNPFRDRLSERTEPVITLEVTPHEGDLESLYELAEAARDSELTLSLSDSPAGDPLPVPDGVAVEIARIMGRQPMVHVSCKGHDRDGLESRLSTLYSHGLRNVFIITGDYPSHGRAAFDVDAVALLWAVRAFRQGLDFPEFTPRAGAPLADLFAGAAVSPFKYTEADVWGQYLKLWKKRRVGAQFFITQVGFDVKKFHELQLYMKKAGMADVPVLGNVFVLSPESVLGFHRGRIPGAHVSDDVRDKHRRRLVTKDERELIRKMGFEELAAFDREQSLRRAALLADVLLRGLGYDGIHLGGLAAFDDVAELLELRRELAAGDWRESYEAYRAGDGEGAMVFAPAGGFYLFEEGADGLLADGPYQTGNREAYARTSRAMSAIHHAFFERGSPGGKLLELSLRGSDERGIGRAVKFVEQAVKTETLWGARCAATAASPTWSTSAPSRPMAASRA